MWCIRRTNACQQRSRATVLHIKGSFTFQLAFLLLEVDQLLPTSCFRRYTRYFWCIIGCFHGTRPSPSVPSWDVQRIVKDFTRRRSQGAFLCLYRCSISVCRRATKGHVHVLTGVSVSLWVLNNQSAPCHPACPTFSLQDKRAGFE